MGDGANRVLAGESGSLLRLPVPIVFLRRRSVDDNCLVGAAQGLAILERHDSHTNPNARRLGGRGKGGIAHVCHYEA